MEPSTELKFVKMQAQGNSYIYFDFLEDYLPEIDYQKFAQVVSGKSFGIGADGIVFIMKDKEADAQIRIWNSDGSEAMMCGSALRSVMAYLYRKNDGQKNKYAISLASGISTGKVSHNEKGYVVEIDINGVQTILIGEKTHDDAVENLINIGKWIGLPVSVGNSHFVVIDRFQEYEADLASEELIQRIGPMISEDQTFPEGVNLELVKIVNPRQIVVRVWERGSGETMACGSGACAAVYAGFHLGFLDVDTEVIFPGGSVSVSYDCLKSKCRLSGSVGFICEGTLDLSEIMR